MGREPIHVSPAGHDKTMRKTLLALFAFALPLAAGCEPYHHHHDDDGLEDACMFSACLVDTCLLDEHPRYAYSAPEAPPPPQSYHHQHGPGCGCPSRWYRGHRIYWYEGHWEYE